MGKLRDRKERPVIFRKLPNSSYVFGITPEFESCSVCLCTPNCKSVNFSSQLTASTYDSRLLLSTELGQ